MQTNLVKSKLLEPKYAIIVIEDFSKNMKKYLYKPLGNNKIYRYCIYLNFCKKFEIGGTNE